MSDSVEIPEANDHFQRKIALTIAVMAVILAFISTKGDNAKSDGLLAATKASSQWSYYQAKSIKEHSYSLQKEIISVMPAQALDQKKVGPLLESFDANIKRYGTEKDSIMSDAKKLDEEVQANGQIDNRCDDAGLFLQVAIVIASIAILVSWPLLWYVSILLGVIGSGVGLTAFFM